MVPTTTLSPTLRPDGPTAGHDDLDDLFDYDVELDDIFSARAQEQAKEQGKAAAVAAAAQKEKERNGSRRRDGDGSGLGLGLDEEVVVDKKVRAPRVKLDEEKLRSKAGIPRLKERGRVLKFKGKGHEYSDAARLLQFYQLWLDDLFPKAKFLDAAAMVEKLGHKRVVQIMRKGWIDEEKPKSHEVEEEIGGAGLFDEPALPPREADITMTAADTAAVMSGGNGERAVTPPTVAMSGENDEDLYGATPRVQRTKSREQDGSGSGEQIGSIFGPKKTDSDMNVDENDEPEDDLDALLAEKEMQDAAAAQGEQSHSQISGPEPEPDFEDEMEVWREMEG